MSVIDVSDLDVHVLIAALWKRSHPAAFFMMNRFPAPQECPREDIKQHLAHSKYIDYLNGRCIKVDFSDLTKVNTNMYNRDMGPNAFENIVAQLRR